MFRGLTMDNGSEFVNRQRLEKSCLHERERTICDYAQPAAHEREGAMRMQASSFGALSPKRARQETAPPRHHFSHPALDKQQPPQTVRLQNRQPNLPDIPATDSTPWAIILAFRNGHDKSSNLHCQRPEEVLLWVTEKSVSERGLKVLGNKGKVRI